MQGGCREERRGHSVVSRCFAAVVVDVVVVVVIDLVVAVVGNVVVDLVVDVVIDVVVVAVVVDVVTVASIINVYEWMDRWMDEWMNEWMDGWMNGWMRHLEERAIENTQTLNHRAVCVRVFDLLVVSVCTLFSLSLTLSLALWENIT